MMLDLFMIGIGVASFAILVLYTHACDRMWGRHDFRTCTRRDRLARPAGLSRLCADPSRTIL